MGAAPLLALNLVAWPREGLPFELLARVIDGGADVVSGAGAIVAGGHSIDDQEPKFGLAVLGTVEPDRVWTNSGAQPGDQLVLTKPIGLGVISTAVKREGATDAILAAAIDLMTTLNAGARDAGRALGDAVHAVTDVTGFGLLGHLGEMARGSGAAAIVDATAVPVIDGVRDLVADGFVAGGTQRNHAFVSEFVDWNGLAPNEQMLLADAQTSGGLLFSVAPDAVDELVAGLRGGRNPGRGRGRCDRARNPGEISPFAEVPPSPKSSDPRATVDRLRVEPGIGRSARAALGEIDHGKAAQPSSWSTAIAGSLLSVGALAPHAAAAGAGWSRSPSAGIDGAHDSRRVVTHDAVPVARRPPRRPTPASTGSTGGGPTATPSGHRRRDRGGRSDSL